jgi:acyl transferase domain-containing protein
MVSAMTGAWLDGPEADAGYWYDSLRAPVEFGRAVAALAAAGHRVFVEVSPHPVLAAAIADDARVVAGTLRRDDGGAARFLASLASLHVLGVRVGWAAVLGGGRRTELPTYAFQHERFWPRPAPAVRAAGAVALGLGAVGHPLLGAAVELAGADGLVLTGLMSVRSHPWLADHAVAGDGLRRYGHRGGERGRLRHARRADRADAADPARRGGGAGAGDGERPRARWAAARGDIRPARGCSRTVDPARPRLAGPGQCAG